VFLRHSREALPNPPAKRFILGRIVVHQECSRILRHKLRVPLGMDRMYSVPFDLRMANALLRDVPEDDDEDEDEDDEDDEDEKKDDENEEDEEEGDGYSE